MKRLFSLCLLCCLLLTACTAYEHQAPAPTPSATTTATTSTATTTTAPATTSTTAAKDWSVLREGKFPPLSLDFCSGAGAWMTSLDIREDGSFSGLYSDSDMGDSGENYPHGTRYTCSFTGRFEVTSVTANTATLKLTALTYAQEKDTVWYEDGLRYIAAEAYGLAGHTEFVLYLPNTPTADLPEEAKQWQLGDVGAETIDCFALYCPAGGDTFFGG